MKSILISIQPKWCELIASGKKTIEVRKTRPKIETPFKCYIYMTATKERCMFWEYITAYQNSNGDILDGSQKVIGEFVCNGIMRPNNNLSRMAKESCLTEKELFEYSKGKTLYGWRISDLKIYDKPKKLGEFKQYNRKCKYEDLGFAIPKCKDCADCKITRAPQSWCYVEETE